MLTALAIVAVYGALCTLAMWFCHRVERLHHAQVRASLETFDLNPPAHGSSTK